MGTNEYWHVASKQAVEKQSRLSKNCFAIGKQAWITIEDWACAASGGSSTGKQLKAVGLYFVLVLFCFLYFVTIVVF
jgi:hypothetical protein